MMRAMPGHVSANRRITVAFQLGARDRKWSTTAGRGTSRECPVWDTYLPDFRDNLAGSSRPKPDIEEPRALTVATAPRRRYHSGEMEVQHGVHVSRCGA
jgi:hypothetical protein